MKLTGIFGLILIAFMPKKPTIFLAITVVVCHHWHVLVPYCDLHIEGGKEGKWNLTFFSVAGVDLLST